MATAGDFGEEHMRIVRDAFAPTASQAEFEVMWAGAKSRGLDPVKKQIHFVKRWDSLRGCDVWSSQVSIDGFRSLAESTGLYDGQDEPEFTYTTDGEVMLARVRVYRKDISRAFVGVARWNEYVQTTKNGEPSHMWRKMEHAMLGKCAEALALRKAFPEKLGGLYTGDEMAQADNPVPLAPEWKQIEHPAPPAQLPPPAAPARGAGAALAAIEAAKDSAEVNALLAGIPAEWPKVRGNAWRKLLTFAPDAAIVDTVSALMREDIADPAILGKLMADAHARKGVLAANGAQPAAEPGAP